MSEILDALYAGDESRVAVLLAEDPELDVFEAAALGRTELVAARLDAAPALAAAFGPGGFTPLHLAAFYRHPEMARLLVERGAPVDAVARNEELVVTPLHSAAAARETDTAELLLAHGADANARQRGGFTPLHAAAQHGDERLVDLLLAYGADPAAAADDGRAAADFAREAGRGDLADRLARPR